MEDLRHNPGPMIVIDADLFLNASDLDGRLKSMCYQKMDGDGRLGEITHPGAGEERAGRVT